MQSRVVPRVLLAGVTLGLILAAGSVHAEDEEQSARDLFREVLEALPKDSFEARMKLTGAGDEDRELILKHKFIDGARASYLEVVAPEELEGIRFLFLERVDGAPEQYIKVAASRTPVQVADRIRKQPFLESAFYVSDLVEPELDAFTYEFVGEEEVLGRKCRLVEAKPKDPGEALYSKTVATLAPEDKLVLKREFFDKDGRLLKVWTVEEVEKTDGNWTIMDQRMVNAQRQKQSRLKVLKVDYGVELPDSLFSPTYLKR